jgi:streptogramin lyase
VLLLAFSAASPVLADWRVDELAPSIVKAVPGQAPLVRTTHGIFPLSPLPGKGYAFDESGELIFPRVDPDGRILPGEEAKAVRIREIEARDAWTAAALSSGAGPIKITEYPVSTNPDTLEADPQGNIWFTMWSKKIGVHYKSNDSIQLINVPTTGTTDGNAVDEKGDVWVGNSILELGVYHVATSNWELFTVPFGQTVDIPRVDPAHDTVWFTDHPGNIVGEFNRTSRQFKQHNVPTASSWVVDPEIDAAGNVWMTAYYDHSLMMIDRTNGQFTTHKTTMNPSNPAFCQFNPAKTKLYLTGWAGYVGEFDLASKTFKEWAVPGQPSGMGYDPNGFIWYAANTDNKIGLLFPNNGTVIDEVVPTSGAGMKDGGYVDQNNPGVFWFSETQASKIGKAEYGGTGQVIDRVEVSPATASITADQTQQFTAAAFDPANNTINATFTWSASGGSVSATGLFTPQATGTFTVTATAGGKSGTASVTVAHGAAVKVNVAPQGQSITADQTLSFTAEGEDAKANKWPLSSPTWSVQGGAGAGAIDAAGLYRPDKVGTWTIEGQDAQSGLKGSAQITVTPGAVATITVSPPSASITADETQQFTAAAVDQKGNGVPTTFSWSATAGAVSSGGLYTPDKAGSWTVTAGAGGKQATASVDVSPGALARIELSPATVTLTADDTQQFSTKGFDAKGNERPVTIGWRLDGGAPAGTVTSGGLYTPSKVGTWTLAAAEGAIQATARITVKPGRLALFEMTPEASEVDKGAEVKFTLKLEDAKGNVVAADKVTWKVEGDSLGTFDEASRTLKARNAGEATYTATVTAGAEEKSETSRVMVRGGLFDTKGGGQLYYLLSVLFIVVAAIAAGLVLLARKRRRDLAAQPPVQQPPWPAPDQPHWSAYQQPHWPPPQSGGYDQQGWPPPPGGPQY